MEYCEILSGVSVVGLSNANRLPACSTAFCYRFTPPRSAFLAASLTPLVTEILYHRAERGIENIQLLLIFILM